MVAECPTLPGCISQGKTRKEALENIRDAIKGYLASLKKHHEPIPPSIKIAKGTLRKIIRDTGLSVPEFRSLQ